MFIAIFCLVVRSPCPPLRAAGRPETGDELTANNTGHKGLMPGVKVITEDSALYSDLTVLAKDALTVVPDGYCIDESISGILDLGS